MRIIGRDDHTDGQQLLRGPHGTAEVVVNEEGTAHVTAAHRTDGGIDEAEVYRQVAKFVVTVGGGVRFAAGRERDHIGGHIATAAQHTIARAVADRIAVAVAVRRSETERLDGQLVVERTTLDEVGVGNHHQQVAGRRLDEGVRTGAVCGGAHQVLVHARREDITPVGVGVEFDGHAGNAAFATVHKAVVVGILPDLVANHENRQHKAEVVGAVVGTGSANIETNGTHPLATCDLEGSVAVARVVVNCTRAAGICFGLGILDGGIHLLGADKERRLVERDGHGKR